VGKLLRGGLSSLLFAILSHFYPLGGAVSVYLAQQTETLAHLDFHQALTVSAACAWAVWLLFFALVVRIAKKSSRKSL